jgi:hypothetical protein
MLPSHRLLNVTLALGCAWLLACGDDSPAGSSDDAAIDDAAVDDAAAGDAGDAGDDPFELSASLFAPTELLEIELTLPDADWEQIRSEGRSVNAVFSSCDDLAFGYTEVPASAVIDGESIDGIGLRKKGFLGSLSTLRPSLRIDFAETDAKARFRGVKGLTLNNNRQDPSLVNQCLAYSIFAAAGVPAPRCSFAHVTVNGEDLGIYTNVEQVGKPLLARYFESDEGDLFEGNPGADFRADMLGRFEKKTNESDPSDAPLQALTEALVETDESALAAVEELVDLDAFMRFWAVESLISHWDGYTGDHNNFFVYQDPSTEQLAFLPWGTDGAFDRNHGFLPEVGRPASVFAMARLPRRLYAWPSTRERYRDALRDVLASAWNEDDLLAEIDRIAELVGNAADPVKLEVLRDFVRSRRGEVQPELDAEAPDWRFDERMPIECRDESIEVSGTFEVAWGDIELLLPGADNTLEAPIDGQGDSFTELLGSAGLYDQEVSLRGPSIRLATLLPGGSGILVQMAIGPRPLEPGTYPFHGLETSGFIALGTTEANATVLGFFGEGEIVIEEGSMAPGAAVRGHFSGRMVPVDFP